MVLGYPEGLTRKDIPIEGQIIRVADEFDAIVSKRQYKSHIGITDTLKILVENSQPTIPKSIALKTMEETTKLGKLNPKIVKTLFKVVIDDIGYEISCLYDYKKYLKEQMSRLEQINNYYIKMENTTRLKKKDYYKAVIEMMLEKGEDIRNYKYILEEYRTAIFKRQEIINNLFVEIKQIKKLRV